MTEASCACVVLAAGKSTRMNTGVPKVLHRVAGRPLIGHVLAAVAALKPARSVVVVSPGMEAVAQAAAPARVAVQARPLGTGDAVKAARKALDGFHGPVLVLYADTPFIAPATLARLAARVAAPDRPAVVATGMRPKDATLYGRLVTGGGGALEAIVEHRDATPAQRKIGLCNAGAMAVDGRHLFRLLDRVGNANAKGEYYLTGLVGVARREGLGCAVIECPEEEMMGIDTRAKLAQAEAIAQARLRAKAMARGVTLRDPHTVWLSADTEIGRDTVIGQNVVFGPGVVVGAGVEILPFCHIEGAVIENGARVGPFARLRPGTRVGPGAHVGNYVEVKNARLEKGAKVNHLSYIGDARVGAGANVGAGTITCNYDGYAKHRTEIGAGAFIGSNVALVAPVKVGAGAIVGAGTVVVKDVPRDALRVERAEQATVPGWAAKFRARHTKAKARRKKKR